MNTLSALELLLDPARLSEIYGQDVRACRVRVKPQVALIAALQDPHTGAELGWLRLLWPVSHPKAHKAASLARSLGHATRVLKVTGQLLCDTGNVESDPALAQLLAHPATPPLPAAAGEQGAGRGGAGERDTGGGGALLRYNPLRRVVYRSGGGDVVRVQARPGVLDHHLYALLAKHAPLPTRLDTAAPGQLGRQVSVVQHCGHHDLAACGQTESANKYLDHHRAAGRIFARLHQGGGEFPADMARALAARAAHPRRQAEAHASILDHLAPPLAGRMRHLATHPGLETRAAATLCHGDASADQVLVDANTGRLWLTDFDRVCFAPAVRDLGSYLALCDDAAAAAFLDGYAESGLPLPTQKDLRSARAASLLARAAEPLRMADPCWEAHINTRLDQIEEALQ